MVVERFSHNLINTGIFKVYIAIGFFATLIFFIFNTELFSPLQMLFGAILVTVFLKGCSNLMLSFIVEHFSLENRKQEFDVKYNEEKLTLLLNQYSIDELNENEDEKEQEIEELLSEEQQEEENLTQELEENNQEQESA